MHHMHTIFFTTIINSCAFWDSMYAFPLHLVFLFFSACLLHVTKSYQGVNFLYRHLTTIFEAPMPLLLYKTWASVA